MHCRARSHRDVSGINELHWATKSSVYGRGETSMFGSANGLQLCIYNKTEQARATDKLDYWESVWRRRDSFDETDPDNYDPTQDVWRVEPVSYTHLDVYKRQACWNGKAIYGSPCAICRASHHRPHLANARYAPCSIAGGANGSPDRSHRRRPQATLARPSSLQWALDGGGGAADAA